MSTPHRPTWRRLGFGVATLFSLASQLDAAATASRVVVVEERRFYALDARDEVQLRRQMHERRARGDRGTTSHGLTEQALEARYVLLDIAGRCRLTDLEVQVQVTIWLPRWEPAADVPESLRQRWAQMLEGLAAHELGHRDNAVIAGEELHDTLLALPAMADCRTLEQQARLATTRSRLRAQLRDQAYDRRTAHGERQGASIELQSARERGRARWNP